VDLLESIDSSNAASTKANQVAFARHPEQSEGSAFAPMTTPADPSLRSG
jgi:hypothetical protein